MFDEIRRAAKGFGPAGDNDHVLGWTLRRGGKSSRRSRVLAGVAAASLVLAFAAACADDDGGDSGTNGSEDVGPGMTEETTFPEFEPTDEVGAIPDLRPVVAFVQDSPRGFEQQFAAGLKAGAEDAGLEFEVAQSDADSRKEVQAMEQFLVEGVAALMVFPVDPNAQAPVLKRAIADGVVTGIIPPAIHQIAAPQYLGGKALGDMAAEYIEEELDGEAEVVILSQDSVVFVRPRFEAIRDALATVPGVSIVADIEPGSTDTKGGFETMNTILQQHPEVDVVLGADAVVLGAKQALESAGKDDPQMFLGGVDCEQQALDYIAAGDSSYKGCVGLSPEIFGYVWANYVGRWLEGKSIPQQMCVRPVPVGSAEEVDQYREDGQEPAEVFQDEKRLAKYIGLYGSISYETRENYQSFQWNPETC
jgi:ribose transport system substrate-binding protein